MEESFVSIFCYLVGVFHIEPSKNFVFVCLIWLTKMATTTVEKHRTLLENIYNVILVCNHRII